MRKVKLGPLRIAIVGGGIGGLVLALALRRIGLAADVFEQSAELTEIGAAVALSANATRELDRLGLLDGIAVASTEPTELIYRDWRDGTADRGAPGTSGKSLPWPIRSALFRHSSREPAEGAQRRAWRGQSPSRAPSVGSR